MRSLPLLKGEEASFSRLHPVHYSHMCLYEPASASHVRRGAVLNSSGCERAHGSISNIVLRYTDQCRREAFFSDYSLTPLFVAENWTQAIQNSRDGDIYEK